MRISGTVAPGKAPELIEIEEMMEEQALAQEASAAAAIAAIEPIEIDTGWSVSPTTVVLGLLGVGILAVGYFIYRTMSASSDGDEDEDEVAGEDVAGDDGATREDGDEAAHDDADEVDDSDDAPMTDDETTESSGNNADWGEIDDEGE